MPEALSKHWPLHCVFDVFAEDAGCCAEELAGCSAFCEDEEATGFVLAELELTVGLVVVLAEDWIIEVTEELLTVTTVPGFVPVEALEVTANGS